MSQSSFLCCRNSVKANDCIPPIVAIHAVRDSSAGYLFTDDACHFSTKVSIADHASSIHFLTSQINYLIY
jgi:hypothetical protein